jgi:hypothetical protein
MSTLRALFFILCVAARTAASASAAAGAPAFNSNYTHEDVESMTGFDANYRYGSMGASRLIVMLVGTFPSTCSQTGASFFGNPASFASSNDARILCVFRPGTQYGFGDVPNIVRNVNSQIAQMSSNPTVFVSGYSNGGGVGAWWPVIFAREVLPTGLQRPTGPPADAIATSHVRHCTSRRATFIGAWS